MEDSPVQFQGSREQEPPEDSSLDGDKRKRILIAAAAGLVLLVALWALWKAEKAYDKAKSASASVEAVQNKSQDQLLRDSRRLQQEIRQVRTTVTNNSEEVQSEITNLQKRTKALADDQKEASSVQLRATQQINNELDSLQSRVASLENRVRQLQEQP